MAYSTPARETARIGQIEALMGIIPSGGGTQYLLERVGRNRALELVLTGDAVEADIAASYGWINRAIPANDLDAFVDRLGRGAQTIEGERDLEGLLRGMSKESQRRDASEQQP